MRLDDVAIHRVLEAGPLRHLILIALQYVLLEVLEIDVAVLHHRIVRVLHYAPGLADKHLRRRLELVIVRFMAALRWYRELQGRAKAHRVLDDLCGAGFASFNHVLALVDGNGGAGRTTGHPIGSPISSFTVFCGHLQVHLPSLRVYLPQLLEQIVLERVVLDLLDRVEVDRVVVGAELLPLEEVYRGLVQL